MKKYSDICTKKEIQADKKAVGKIIIQLRELRKSANLAWLQYEADAAIGCLKSGLRG